jgi:uncharacterized phage infection (PIP) family protein YhgE
MKNVQALNLGSTGPVASGVNPDGPRVEDEFSRTRDLMEQTRAESRRTRMQVERQQEQHDAHERRTKILSIVLVVFILALIGAGWYTYPTLKAEKDAIGEVTGLRTVASTLVTRLSSVEGNLQGITDGLPILTGRMDQLQATMKANLQTARTQAQAATTQMGQKIREEVNQSLRSMQSQITGIQSNQKESTERVVQLQEQVAGLSRELASMRDANAAAAERIKQLSETQQTSNAALSGLNDRMASHQASLTANQTALTNLTTRVDRKRVDFKIPNRHTEQVAPGIYLNVSRSDLKKQEIDGTMQISKNGSTMNIRGQGANKPFVFYLRDEYRPLELVITQVAKDSAAGYVMTPVPLQ